MINLLSMVESREALWNGQHRGLTSEEDQGSPGRADSSHMYKGNSSVRIWLWHSWVFLESRMRDDRGGDENMQGLNPLFPAMEVGVCLVDL